MKMRKSLDEIFYLENLEYFVLPILYNVYCFIEDIRDEMSKNGMPYLSSPFSLDEIKKVVSGKDNLDYLAVCYWPEAPSCFGLELDALTKEQLITRLEKMSQYTESDPEYFDIAVFDRNGKRLSLKKKITYSLEE